MTDAAPTPPAAKRVPVERAHHGDTVVDEYAWLRDRDDPDAVAYLEAENAYTDAVTAPTAPLRERIFEEIKARTQETDLSVPVRKGPYWYYARTEEGLQYPIRCRRLGEEGPEEVLVDENALAEGHDYLSLGVLEISPDHRLLAFSTDTEGDEVHVLRLKDLTTGEVLADEIPGTSYGLAWAADSGSFFYTTLDETMRPWRVHHHVLGTDAGDDRLVHQEDDGRFFVTVGATRSEAFVVIHLGSAITSEVRVVPTDRPLDEPRILEPRRHGVEYSIDHHTDRFYVLTNDEGATNFALYQAPVDDPRRVNWRPVIEHREDTRLDDVDAFAGHLVVSQRRDGLTGLRVIDLGGGGGNRDLAFDEAVYTVHAGANPEFDTTDLRFGYESLVTPPSVYDEDLVSGERVLRKRQPVLGGFDPAEYASARLWAAAADGTSVPISLVHRKGVTPDGANPLVLYGYGSYESSVDPWFSVARLSLLDRGVVFAVAHVRGGGDLGRSWYETGKLAAKTNTFTDFVACAEHLCAAGWTNPDRLAARGRSAGGLLMGAIANLAPERFRVIVAEVPFVDALTTMLDPTLPLVEIEREEWGDPLADPEIYRVMKGYSPYDNVSPVRYPAILATAGLNDPRVSYHEPAKWVARLRATAAADPERPILLRTELGAGHGGPSGRYDAWRDEAFVLAFICWQLGVS